MRKLRLCHEVAHQSQPAIQLHITIFNFRVLMRSLCAHGPGRIRLKATKSTTAVRSSPFSSELITDHCHPHGRSRGKSSAIQTLPSMFLRAA